MTDSPDFRRYLVDIDSVSTHQVSTDYLVLGAGIAGLRAAIEAAQNAMVCVVTKGAVEDSNTWNAQGGIASVLDKGDSFESHIADTLRTGCGLCDDKVVDLVVRQGPQLIRQLIDWGCAFDLTDGLIATTLEGGHSHPRIAHAHGDETGKIIAQTLIAKAREQRKVKIIENFFTIDLLTENNKCLGVIGWHREKGLRIIWASNVILATGGAGQLYRETTNPSCATADGLAIAYRAGAVLQDLEFVQFHPTTLYIAGASRALITETLRGEGAVLRDIKGRAFMKDYNPAAELAPRDIVSRAILQQMLKTKSTHVYLDIRHFDKQHFAKRFPVINELCESFDIDVSKDLIPVRPSAHYMVGGVKTDGLAKTGLENLYAAGEVSSTGLHGANRLGSNSLLEGLVFGKIAGHAEVRPKNLARQPVIKYEIPHSHRSPLDISDVRNSLRAVMWRNVGINRKAADLRQAIDQVRFWQRYVMDKQFDNPQGWELQNMLTVCLLIARSALSRKESRGVHFRSDHPDTDDVHFKKHTEIKRED
ncbi:MAG: L-aspartate oxidase [Sedimentisphaerales bacterium]|nr:L-aspartate oxidase [Sedimentisphaerales bacterium]